MSQFIDEHFDSAIEFLEALRKTNPRWLPQHKKWDQEWIFRGQLKSNWDLMPKAFREDSLMTIRESIKDDFRAMIEAFWEETQLTGSLPEKMLQGVVGDISETKVYDKQIQEEYILQIASELAAVKNFVELANVIGLSIPEGKEILSQGTINLPIRTIITFRFDSLGTGNYLDVKSGVFALAQHHGISTRLLDWTGNALIAAFFAAEAVNPEQPRDFSIAVWAINRKVFRDSKRISLVTIPRSYISYLHAQDSVFTFDQYADRYFLHSGKWSPMEELIEDKTLIRKLTLPASEVGELLRLLWIEGISRAHLMPTFDSVTRSLSTRQMWENR